MTKVLILGAGIYQVPLIKKAKQMGLYTITASYPGYYPGLALADEVWEIDTRDYNRLLTLAQNTDLGGVCTTGTDVAVISLGVLCETLGLTGLTSSCAKLVTDKALMKEAFVKQGVSTPAAIQVFTEDETLRAFRQFKRPVIVKAVDSSGSRGITMAETEADALLAYKIARQVSRMDYVLVEEFITAPEIGVDGFISNGQVQFLLPHEKFTHTINGTTLPEGHAFPYHCSPAMEHEIIHQMELAIRAVGMDNCAINADVLVRDDNAFILEIGARAGATCIPELISIYGGFDYYEQIILNALGQAADFTFHSNEPCMAKLLFSKQDGKITDINKKRLDILRDSGIQVTLDYPVGTNVEAVQNGTSRIGQVIMKAGALKELDLIMSEVRSTIKIDGESLDILWNE